MEKYRAMTNNLNAGVLSAVERFIRWFEHFGETSYDHQSYYASRLGGKAKRLYYKNSTLGKLAVAPMVLSEALLPATRSLFYKKQRLPIADAHYAMGYAFLHQLTRDETYYKRAVHFLEILEKTRCPSYEHYGWGYPFDWETKGGTLKQQTPLITTTPYAYEAFLQVYQIDQNQRWLKILKSIAEHAYRDVIDFEISEDARASAYFPGDPVGGVVNASAYRAFLLMSAAQLFSEDDYRQAAAKNINFIIKSQRPNGSWPYHANDPRDFIDHFHTCFVLKALVKIEAIANGISCMPAIENGIRYYVRELFNQDGLPKPFARSPRLTVYKHELYDYAECINLATLMLHQNSELDRILYGVLKDLLQRWQKPDGSFRSRKLFLGWDNVPMHRWAQSQVFRSLAFYLYKSQSQLNHTSTEGR